MSAYVIPLAITMNAGPQIMSANLSEEQEKKLREAFAQA
jgi:uncharacterized membrane protein